MNRRVLRGLALVAGALALASQVRADAPADQYLPFTRSDKTIIDQQTGLDWERGDPAVAWPTVDSLAAANSRCVGQTRRVPTLKELLTLVDELPTKEYEKGQEIPKYIDTAAFPKTPTGAFYTSTGTGGAAEVYCVDFGTGDATPCSTATKGAYVRCVK